MSESLSIKKVEISGLSCSGLPKIKIHRDDFYIKILVDGHAVEQTSYVPRSQNPKWNDTILFALTDGVSMNVQVYQRRSIGGEHLIGELGVPWKLSTLKDTPDDVDQELVKKKKKATYKSRGAVQFKIRQVTEDMQSTSNIPAPAEVLSNVKDTSKTGTIIGNVEAAITGTTASMKTVQEIYEIWKPLADKVQVVVNAIDVLSEIHPYVQMTWSVVSIPLKIMEGQRDRDGEVLDLLNIINNVYDLLCTAEQLTKLEAHRKTAKALFQQTTECAWFIREYFSRGFAGRILKSLTTDHDSIVQQYKDRFKQLGDAFSTESAINTEITVVQVLAVTQEMELELKNLSIKQDFRDLPYATGQRTPNECLAGTRVKVLRDIIDWFNEIQKASKRMLWLHGLAGCGKSTIAKSIAELLEANGRCVSFYFNASNSSEAGSHNLFSTLSVDLADKNKGWKAALAKTIEGSTKARTSRTIVDQFRNLILEPAKDFDSVGPILIVIDALDECGSADERESVLDMLKRLVELPKQFRFLITSRDEIDIRTALGHVDWIQPYQLDRVDPSSIDNDIRLYVKERLMSISALKNRWNEDWIDQMVIRAGRLFQWAFTACRFIKGSGKVGHDPHERLEILLASQSDTFRDLDSLYRHVLDNLCTFESGDTLQRRFETVMGRILSLYEALPLESLSALYYDEEDKGHVDSILSPLGSLLHGVTGSSEPVQPLHASFREFLLDKERSGKYWVDLEKQKRKIPCALLREMQESLRFNICQLETSYKLNRDIEDLNKRVEQYIPAHLAYACRFWGDHLGGAPITDKEIFALDTLVHTNFLFWLEALSLLRKANIALTQLSKVQNWLATEKDKYRTLTDFLAEAQLFILAFGGVVEQSVPHIYLSALAFVPRDSIISKAYMEYFRDPIDAKFHKIIQWPTSLQHIDVQSEVSCVAFSPDGNRVVSGSWDSTVRIWNAHTGELVAGPFHGHDDGVRSVGFSPDGNRVVSGSRDSTVRIWNAHTGELVAGPFHGHDNGVRSVGFSPDGNRVVSGSWDKTVRIWNAHIGELVAGPFHGHGDAVLSVGFSPDGNRVVSGSQDKTVRPWNAQSTNLTPDSSYGRETNSFFAHITLLPPSPRVISNIRGTMVAFRGNDYSAALVYTDQSIFYNGWMYGPDNELLFWVPLEYRPNLWRSNNMAIIGRGSIRYDFAFIAHGAHWTENYKRLT